MRRFSALNCPDEERLTLSIFRSACLNAMRVAGGSDRLARAFHLPLVLHALHLPPVSTPIIRNVISTSRLLVAAHIAAEANLLVGGGCLLHAGEVADAQGEPEFEPVLGGVEAFAGEVLDPGNPVVHGVSMHVQRGGSHSPNSVGLQEGAQRGQELLGLIGGIERARTASA